MTPTEEETRRVAVERALRERFHFDVRVDRRKCNDARMWIWARLPGSVERSCLEPPIRQHVFEERTVDEVVAAASAIVDLAVAAVTRADPLDEDVDDDDGPYRGLAAGAPHDGAARAERQR